MNSKEMPIEKRNWLIYAALLGFAPLLYWHIAGLLQKPHYQFLYLLPIAIWLLALSKPPTVSQEALPRNGRVEVLGFLSVLVSVTGLMIASYLWSPWIASVAFLIGIPGLLIFKGNWSAFRSFFPMWIFLWIMVPLPFGIDEDLIVRLRGITTRGASAALDQLGILHDCYANVIQLPGKPLFIADACSGIHSLYVLLAAALLIATLLKRGLIHSLLLLASTFVIVLAENITRITLVAVLWERGHDYSRGTSHEMLGAALFVVSLLLILSLDQLLVFILPSRVTPLLERMNQWVTKANSRKSQTKSVQPSGWNKAQLVTGIVILLAPLAGFAQLYLMPSAPPAPIVQTYDDFSIERLGKEALPVELLGFRRQEFAEVNRVPGDPLGQASQQWIYEKDGTSVVVSIDYPYSGAHDLCECYTAIGWHVDERVVYSHRELTDRRIPNAVGPLAVGQLNRELYGHGVLMFNLVDGMNQTSAVIKEKAKGTAAERGNRRLGSFLDTGKEKMEDALDKPPWVQFQLLARLPRPASEEESQELFELFFAARSQLAKLIDEQQPWEKKQ